jgi:hypothetical protein
MMFSHFHHIRRDMATEVMAAIAPGMEPASLRKIQQAGKFSFDLIEVFPPFFQFWT